MARIRHAAGFFGRASRRRIDYKPQLMRSVNEIEIENGGHHQ